MQMKQCDLRKILSNDLYEQICDVLRSDFTTQYFQCGCFTRYFYIIEISSNAEEKNNIIQECFIDSFDKNKMTINFSCVYNDLDEELKKQIQDDISLLKEKGFSLTGKKQ